MVIVDANVLIDAVNEPSLMHEPARKWLESALSGSETIGLPWLTLVAFLRISTSSRVFDRPLGMDRAAEFVRGWLGAPNAAVPEPGATHLDTMTRLLGAAGTAGNLVNDAHLAAIALEHDAEVVTYDRDFGRFPAVRWRTP